jgi:curved DNA-binding protein CbpA
MKTKQKDYYALLGVTPDATSAQIKSAYRKLAKR